MPVELPQQDDLEKKAAELILGDASLRDELTDDEAQPLIDWGLAQVAQIARRASLMASAEAVEAALDDVRRLMKRVNRVVRHRALGDAEAVRSDLERLSELSARLFGDAVPRAALSQVDTFMAEQGNLSNGQVVKRLLGMFAPPLSLASQAAGPEAPPTAAPQTPPQFGALPVNHQLTAPKSPDLLSSGEEREA